MKLCQYKGINSINNMHDLLLLNIETILPERKIEKLLSLSLLFTTVSIIPLVPKTPQNITLWCVIYILTILNCLSTNLSTDKAKVKARRPKETTPNSTCKITLPELVNIN